MAMINIFSFSYSYELRWMNGQHLRSLPSEQLTKLIGERWKSTGILTVSDGPFVEVRPTFIRKLLE